MYYFLCAFVSLVFMQPKAGTVSVTALVGKLLSGLTLGKLTLPHFLPAFDKMFVNRLLIDLQNRAYAIDIAVPGTIVVIKDILSVSGIRAQLEKRNGTFNFSFSANGEIFHQAVTVQLKNKGHILGFPGSTSLHHATGRFSLSARLPNVTLSSVIEHVNAGKSSFSTQLKSFGLLSSSLSNVSFNILTNPLSLRASGHLQLGSLLSATCELLVIHPFQRTNRSFALGIESSDIDLSSLVKLFFKVDISGIPLFGKLHIPSLRLLLIPKEVNFASVHFHTSSLQAFAQELLPHSSALLARIPIQLPKVGDITLPVTLNKQEMSFQVRSSRHMTIHLR